MQINCPECGSKAIIYSRKNLDPKLSKLYCGCKHCATSFAMDLSLSHIISPSNLDKHNIAVEYLRTLPAAERQQFLAFAN